MTKLGLGCFQLQDIELAKYPGNTKNTSSSIRVIKASNNELDEMELDPGRKKTAKLQCSVVAIKNYRKFNTPSYYIKNIRTIF